MPLLIKASLVSPLLAVVWVRHITTVQPLGVGFLLLSFRSPPGFDENSFSPLGLADFSYSHPTSGRARALHVNWENIFLILQASHSPGKTIPRTLFWCFFLQVCGFPLCLPKKRYPRISLEPPFSWTAVSSPPPCLRLFFFVRWSSGDTPQSRDPPSFFFQRWPRRVPPPHVVSMFFYPTLRVSLVSLA